MKFIINFLVALSILSSCKYIQNHDEKINYVHDSESKSLIINKKNTNISNKLRIGLLLPLSGQAKNIGESLLNSAQLAIFKNNKNDILLEVFDTKGTDFGAIDAMNKAIKSGVDTIVGPLFYTETKAITKIAEKNNVLVFSLSNDQKLMNNENILVSGSIPEQEIEFLLNNLISQEKTNFIAFLPNNSNGSEINRILQNKLRDKNAYLIKSEFYTANDPSFDSKLYNLLNSYRVSDEFIEEYTQKKQKHHE